MNSQSNEIELLRRAQPQLADARTWEQRYNEQTEVAATALRAVAERELTISAYAETLLSFGWKSADEPLQDFLARLTKEKDEALGYASRLLEIVTAANFDRYGIKPGDPEEPEIQRTIRERIAALSQPNQKGGEPCVTLDQTIREDSQTTQSNAAQGQSDPPLDEADMIVGGIGSSAKARAVRAKLVATPTDTEILRKGEQS